MEEKKAYTIKYKKVFDRGNAYFDTYYIYNQETKKYVGILEIHCRKVTETYFIGWHCDGDFIPKSYNNRNMKTKFSISEEEAMRFVTEDFTK